MIFKRFHFQGMLFLGPPEGGGLSHIGLLLLVADRVKTHVKALALGGLLQHFQRCSL